MNKFYYFKDGSYIIRVHSSFYKRGNCWATGVSAIKKEFAIIYYSPYVLWDRATKKDWYRVIRLLCVEDRRDIL